MAEDVFGIVGSVIAGAYHVEKVVAEGGFGVVYRAHHGGFRAPVALKLLKVPVQNSAQQAEFLELFRSEAELLFRLSASIPTVVRPLHVDAFTTTDGRFVPYMVLEWLDGMTLDALIKQRNDQGLPPVPLRKLVRLLTPVARALERAHNFSGPEGAVCIVHRDLKPENIFVAQVAGEEVIKILDFGIGKVKSVASQVAGRMSQDAHSPTAFTPAYGAPEQWAPRHYGQTGPWTDVWGLALCIVEVMVARPVIEGDPATMMGIALDPKRRPTPRTEGVELPDAVEAVFARALALDPRQRQRDAGVFWNELVTALQVPDAERSRASQRDPRTEGEGGLRIERVDVPRSSGSQPHAPRPSAAVERALAMDLEFDPVSASRARVVAPEARAGVARAPAPSRAATNSDPHFVPDLELSQSAPRRTTSGQFLAQPVNSQPNPLELEEPAGTSDFPALDLDLPAGDPIVRRAASSARLPAVSSQPQGAAPSRSLSGSMSQVREPLPSRSFSGSLPLVREPAPTRSLSGSVSAVREQTSTRSLSGSMSRVHEPAPSTNRSGSMSQVRAAESSRGLSGSMSEVREPSPSRNFSGSLSTVNESDASNRLLESRSAVGEPENKSSLGSALLVHGSESNWSADTPESPGSHPGVASASVPGARGTGSASRPGSTALSERARTAGSSAEPLRNPL